MKKWIGTALACVASFAVGSVCGWFVRKSTEVKFEEVTEEELNAIAEADTAKKDNSEEGEQEKPAPLSSATEESPLQKTLNTEKSQYWAKWKDEAGKYKPKGELPEGEEPVIAEEPPELDTEEELIIDDDEEKDVHSTLPNIEVSDEDEFDFWDSEPDGEYQAVRVGWFSGDGVLVDDENDPIGNYQRYLGFDPKKEFEKAGIKRGEGGVLYRKNNILQIVYEVTQYPSSFGKRRFVEEYGGNDRD